MLCVSLIVEGCKFVSIGSGYAILEFFNPKISDFICGSPASSEEFS